MSWLEMMTNFQSVGSFRRFRSLVNPINYKLEAAFPICIAIVFFRTWTNLHHSFFLYVKEHTVNLSRLSSLEIIFKMFFMNHYSSVKNKKQARADQEKGKFSEYTPMLKFNVFGLYLLYSHLCPDAVILPCFWKTLLLKDSPFWCWGIWMAKLVLSHNFLKTT